MRLDGWMIVAAVGLLGCPSDTEGVKGAPSASSSSAASVAPVASAAPMASIDLSPVEGRHEVTHLGPAPSKAENEQCAPLPAARAGKAGKLAQVLRKLTCGPGLFFQRTAEVAKLLDLPEGVTFEFTGPRSATIRVKGELDAGALAKAIGLDAPVVKPSGVGMKPMSNWYLGTNAKTGAFDHWGPATLLIGVDTAAAEGDEIDTVKPLTDEKLSGWIGVTMPMKVKDDDVALKMLVRAAHMIAADPKLLSKEPDEVAKAVGVDDERFRVSRVAIGTGPKAIKGIDIWVRRSQVGAPAIISALGLKGSIEHERATDTNAFGLYRNDKMTHIWRGVSLEPTFEPRPHGKTRSSKKDFELDGLRIMPM